MKIQSYKQLTVWQKSISLVDEVYKVTRLLPASELYGLASQSQRSAVSIPANIAEGYARNHRPEFIQFLGIAYGSSAELETHLIIMMRQYPNVDCSNTLTLLTEIQKMLYTIINKLKVSSR